MEIWRWRACEGALRDVPPATLSGPSGGREGTTGRLALLHEHHARRTVCRQPRKGIAGHDPNPVAPARRFPWHRLEAAHRSGLLRSKAPAPTRDTESRCSPRKLDTAPNASKAVPDSARRLAAEAIELPGRFRKDSRPNPSRPDCPCYSPTHPHSAPAASVGSPGRKW